MVEQWTENPHVSGSSPLLNTIFCAEMVKLVYTLDLESNAYGRKGSTPFFGRAR